MTEVSCRGQHDDGLLLGSGAWTAAENGAGDQRHGTFHSYYGHNHLDFDREAGPAEFVAGVNRLFARNGIAYELGSTGRVRRIAPPVLDEALFHTAFSTGDTDTDNLLESARRRFLHQDPIERGVGLEPLWDAFERVKTLGPGKDKKASVKALLDRVAEGPFRAVLDADGTTLTRIGNDFRIRHAEARKTPIGKQEELDYLFHRRFAWLWLVLRKSGRGGQ